MVKIFKAKKLLIIQNYIKFQNLTRGNKLSLASEHKIQTKINFNGLEAYQQAQNKKNSKISVTIIFMPRQ